MLDDGIGDVIDPDVVCSVVGERSHEGKLLQAFFRGRYAGEARTDGKVQPNKSGGT
ncbi:hypothetical protein PPUJ20188_54700 [Pseudomonas putida]|nr:hypothetical protein PPUJ20188_54700 [Pseudomonas putida]